MNRSVMWAIAVAAFPVLGSAADHAGRDARFFDRRVEPILRAHCVGCHNDKLKDGGLSLASRNDLLLGGTRGPAIVPGYPDASLLMQAVRQDGALMMPPGGKLSARDIATLTKWIRRGAPWGRSCGIVTLASGRNAAWPHCAHVLRNSTMRGVAVKTAFPASGL